MKLLIALAIVAIGWSFANNKKSITIQEEHWIKLISLVANSTGEMNGLSVRLNIKNLAKKSMIVVVPAGTEFITGDPNDQNMFIPMEQEIFVDREALFILYVDIVASPQTQFQVQNRDLHLVNRKIKTF